MGPQTNSNNFFGIAVSLPGINVNEASPSQMMYTNDYSTTTWRDNNGNITLQEGLLPSGNYGQNVYNGTSQYSLSGTPQILIGVLPDGTVGIVQSISGVNVNNLFS